MCPKFNTGKAFNLEIAKLFVTFETSPKYTIAAEKQLNNERTYSPNDSLFLG